MVEVKSREPAMPDQLMSIGELASRTGVAVSALRYYEQAGLLPVAARIAGQRHYQASAVQLVGLILLLKDLGFSLREMKPLIDGLTYRTDGWRDLVGHKIADLGQRIATAQTAHSALEHALDCPGPSLLDCPRITAAVQERLVGRPPQAGHSH
jgi:DNA-binding transcriptional MerR regulator